MSKYYEVRFYTKKGGEQSWIIHVEAKTAKEAKEIAIHKWACDRRFSGMHQFGIKVRLLKADEEFRWHYFSLIGEGCFNS